VAAQHVSLVPDEKVGYFTNGGPEFWRIVPQGKGRDALVARHREERPAPSIFGKQNKRRSASAGQGASKPEHLPLRAAVKRRCCQVYDVHATTPES
jgi:hypothetical protein